MTTGRELLSEPRQQDGPSLAAHTLLSAVATYTNTILVSPRTAPAGEEGGGEGRGGCHCGDSASASGQPPFFFFFFYGNCSYTATDCSGYPGRRGLAKSLATKRLL